MPITYFKVVGLKIWATNHIHYYSNFMVVERKIGYRMNKLHSSCLLLQLRRFPFLCLSLQSRFGYKIDFSRKESWLLKPFLLIYISITINHNLGTNLFFCLKGSVVKSLLTLCTYLSQLIKIWVQTWFLPESFGCQTPFYLCT
jgi:hypothetical protein